MNSFPTVCVCTFFYLFCFSPLFGDQASSFMFLLCLSLLLFDLNFLIFFINFIFCLSTVNGLNFRSFVFFICSIFLLCIELVSLLFSVCLLFIDQVLFSPLYVYCYVIKFSFSLFPFIFLYTCFLFHGSIFSLFFSFFFFLCSTLKQPFFWFDSIFFHFIISLSA